MLTEIKIPVIYNSSSIFTEGSKTDRLISLLKNLGDKEYISAPAAKNYIEPEKFEKAGIKLTWFEYEHPIYPQIRGEFISYLSVLDLLFNVGEKSVEYIRSGIRNSEEV